MDVDEQKPDIAALGGGHTGEESDFYEEEMKLFVDFDICLDLEDPNLLIKVIGIESENPIIQVNDEVYRATPDFAFGTNVFFEKDPQRTAMLDPVFENNIKDMYKYVDKTDKVFRMKRIFLTDKSKEKQEPSDQESSSEEQIEDKNKYEVNMTYEAALNQHLPEGCMPPRHIAGRLNGTALVKNRHGSDVVFEKGESSKHGLTE
ncbi:uncharacterized protein LOC128721612 [Anopheles nili]|uniref:uncharacterized protein LOC128721612 n=1 Tax=Anopheles nili TaxID=185578 RepID=UPI00237B38CC|nr:uncharacterized protein LOC128721612 [Anopheles nili]